jgi:signal transduction histidine kinase
LLFSSVITLASTSLQLYIDYARDVDLIYDRMRQIKDSYLESIGASLWAFDREQLQVQVEGIHSLPDMRHVEVVVDGRPFVTAGWSKEGNTIHRSFPLDRVYQGERIKLGTLNCTASLDGIYGRLRDRVLVILGTQAIKTFLVSAFIFLMFQYLVTRHLVRMADYARGLMPGNLDAPLKLERPPRGKEQSDELDIVASAMNEMRTNLASNLKELEAEHSRRCQAEQLAGIGQLAANIAHEIRNPLASIINGAELLGRPSVASASKDEVVALINAETQRLKRILDDFLGFARRRPSEPKPNDLSRTIQHVVETVRLGLNDERAITIDVDIERSLGQANFDSEHIEQVLWNLLLNSLRAMPKGGRVLVKAWRTGPRIKVLVIDTGIGMSPSLAEHAAEPFVAGAGNGTGLGLSIARRILADHGSTLTISSAPDKGTTIAFSLDAIGATCKKS